MLGRFFDDCCVLKKLLEVQASKLYEAYSVWCEKSGERPHAANKFGQLVGKRNQFRKIKKHLDGKSAWFWLGIGLVDGGTFPEFGTAVKHSHSKGFKRSEEKGEPDLQVRHKGMPSRNPDGESLEQFGTGAEKSAEESSNDVVSDAVPNPKILQNKSGTSSITFRRMNHNSSNKTEGVPAEDLSGSLSRLIVKGDKMGVRLLDALEQGLPGDKVKAVLDMRQSGQLYHAGKILNRYLEDAGIAGLSGKQVDRMLKEFRAQNA